MMIFSPRSCFGISHDKIKQLLDWPQQTRPIATATLITWQHLVPKDAIEAMLMAIEEMKYFLRMARGDSKDLSGSSTEVKFQGLCQGNGAASAGWAVISIVILKAHKEKDYRAHFVCPISNLRGHLTAILLVDDTDIIHVNLREDQTGNKAYDALHNSIYNQGQLIMETGGAFKPIK